MSDEIAKKIGRGGAGNFYTKADVENALHASLPPQKFSSSPPSRDAKLESSNYARTGRGGIGNYVSSPQEPLISSSYAENNIQSAREALDASRTKLKDMITGDKSPTYRGHSGRGGAGNWRQGNEEVERRRIQEEEIKVRDRIDESIRLNVEKGLKQPPKVYTTPESASGRGE